jgi:predicted translin family RNA/ssDNA-binding protein
MNDIEQAEHVLNNLRQKREHCVKRGRELTDERAAIALAAHTGDKAASKRLQEINAALALHNCEIESIDAALAEATKRLAVAQAAEAHAVQAAKAAECAKVVDELAPVFGYVDKHFKAVVDGLLAIEMGFAQLRAHGVTHPTDVQVRLGVVTAIHTWAMQMPKNWHSELRDGMRFLAPHERRDFSTYWKAVEPMLQNQIGQHLDKPEAAREKEDA